MSHVRAGVAGVGHLGYHHARIYSQMEGVTLTGVADPDPSRGRKAAADFGTRWFATVAELLEAGVDAASVAVPTVAHHETAMALISAGVDVLVEKPLAATLDEARAMVAAAKAAGGILQVGHIERFNGAMAALMEVLRKPLFIECHRLSPYPGRGSDVSVVLDLMIHDLDLVLTMVGSELTSVDAVGVPVFSEQEDIANVRLRFKTGCVANITCSRVSVDRMRKLRVFEPDAYYSTDFSDQEVLVYRKKPGPIPAGTSPMEHVRIETLPVVREEPLKRELESFISCVRTRSCPVVDGAAGLAALELAQQILNSIREHP